MSVNETHEEKETLAVDVFLPGHEARTTTPLFVSSRKKLIARDGRCFISGMTAEQAGQPLEAHHHPIERSLANLIDWELFATHAKAGFWGVHAQEFDWEKFFEGAKNVGKRRVPVDPYLFVDDMTVNGLLLSKQFHTHKDSGIHMMPFPLWIAQKYAIEGYQFTPDEVIHHFDPAGGDDAP